MRGGYAGKEAEATERSTRFRVAPAGWSRNFSHFRWWPFATLKPNCDFTCQMVTRRIMRRKLVLLAALLTSVGTMARPVEARSFPGLGEEQVPRNEAAAIERSKGIFQKFMLETYGDQPAGDAKRGVHPVAHGCVRGVLKVRAGVPAWAKKGLFEEPSEYKAWIRFSNASSRPQADREADSRGFAMKVLGVGGDRILERTRVDIPWISR